jgi:hypothetical protein
MAADSEATLPSLIEAVKRSATDDRKRVFQDRAAKLVDARKRALDRARTQRPRTDGTPVPISLPRLSAEVWAQVKNEDWAGGMGTAGSTGSNSGYPWVYDKHYQRGFLGEAQAASALRPLPRWVPHWPTGSTAGSTFTRRRTGT